MAYRLLAVDLDGTLLRADKTIDPTDIAAIRELAGSSGPSPASKVAILSTQNPPKRITITP
jgi:hypothetical protein